MPNRIRWCSGRSSMSSDLYGIVQTTFCVIMPQLLASKSDRPNSAYSSSGSGCGYCCCWAACGGDCCGGGGGCACAASASYSAADSKSLWTAGSSEILFASRRALAAIASNRCRSVSDIWRSPLPGGQVAPQRMVAAFAKSKGATSQFKRDQSIWKGASTHISKRTYCERRTDRVHS